MNNSYEYAFIDNDNVVINVSVFAEHDANLIEQIRQHFSAKEAISCEEFGLASFGGTWDGQVFRYSDGTRVPPTHMPEDDTYIYDFDFDLNEWIIVTTNKLKDLT